jgi:hypothetical protein
VLRRAADVRLEHAVKPKDVFRECENRPEMVVVPRVVHHGIAGKRVGPPRQRKSRETVTLGPAVLRATKLRVTVAQFDAPVRETQCEASSKCAKPLRLGARL